MKRILIPVVLFLALALSALPAAAITNGELDGDGHPNVGIMISEELVDGEVVRWRCSGTLIAPRVFLTAGHCVHNMIAARVWFINDVADIPDYPLGGEVAHEGKPIAHLDYGKAGDMHDVGVVLLDEPVYDIPLATLATPDLLGQLKKDRILEGGYEEGVYFRNVGYGVTLLTWSHPTHDNNKIRMVSESEYVALDKATLHLFQRTVFDESGTCGGDSGGPAFWIDPEGNEIIVAVTSVGDAMCVASSMSYRVDVPDILEWIYSQFPEE
jgi:secreted trypsin-like serine protease